MKKTIKIILITLSLLLIIVASYAGYYMYIFLKFPKLNISKQDTNEQLISKTDTWFTHLQENQLFNGAVLVSQNGKPLLKKGYGWTNAQKNKPINAQSSFRLASVSKQFTATGIMLLKEKELLNFDDLVTNFFPSFPYKHVTLRNLLNQTSGIPDIDYTQENTKTIFTNESVITELIQSKKPLNFKPSSKYEYANINYIILARVIELISNQSFEAFMKQEIFIPLEMKNTRVFSLLSSDKNFENKTDDLYFENNSLIKIQPTSFDGIVGDGAVFSSVDDLLKWNQFWLHNPLISNKTIKEAYITPKLNNGGMSNYGFGLLIENNQIWHNGSWLGARTLLIRNPQKEICIAILENASNPNIDTIHIWINKLNRYFK